MARYTYYGDANWDGKVDGQDYALIDAGFLSNDALTGWYNGDFNYDGKVDASDYTLIDNAYNSQVGGIGAPAAAAIPTLVAGTTAELAPASVPEPSVVGFSVAAAAAAAVAGRRRRTSVPRSAARAGSANR